MPKKIQIRKQTKPKPANKPDKMPFERGESSAGIAQTVYDQLAEDYKKSLLHWVLAASWEQMNVPMDHIDESNKSNWQASKDEDQVKDMADKMQEGWEKPVILVNEPNNSKLQIVDGHHRFLAAQSLNKKEISAFVATVGGVNGQWSDMHRLQRQGEEASGQKSDQVEASNGKA